LASLNAASKEVKEKIAPGRGSVELEVLEQLPANPDWPPDEAIQHEEGVSLNQLCVAKLAAQLRTVV
jgi:hypothetical protein